MIATHHKSFGERKEVDRKMDQGRLSLPTTTTTLGGSLAVTKDGASPMKRSADKARDQTEPEMIMTVTEVAQYLRVHATTIYRLLKENRVPAFRVGSDWRFSRDAIDRWMRSQQKL